MPVIEVEPGINMHYEDRGIGAPIVFIHGWGGSADAWDLQVLDLAHHYRCITVDLRGHGDSDKPWGDTPTTFSSGTCTSSSRSSDSTP